jgi:hypothetical protein
MKAEKRGLRKQMISNLDSLLKFLLGGLSIFTGLAFINVHNMLFAVIFIIFAVTVIASGYFGWRE